MDRFEEMEYVRENVEDHFQKSCILSLVKDDDLIKTFFLKRIKSPGLRSYLGFKIFELVNDKSEKSSVFPLLTAFEASIISTYAFNQILDNKTFGRQKDQVDRMIITGNRANELMYRLICDNYPSKLTHRFIKGLNKVHVNFYRGQFLQNIKWAKDGISNEEKNTIFFERTHLLQIIYDTVKYNHNLDITFEEITPQVDRLFLINGHFFGVISEMIVTEWNNKNSNSSNSLKNWGNEVGIAEQIINDVMDFTLPSLEVESTYKYVEDFYSDLKEGIITLPIYLATEVLKLNYTKSIVLKINEGDKSISLKEMENVLFELCESGIIRTCLEISSKILNSSFDRLYLENFEPCENLLNLKEMPFKNKYFYAVSDWWRKKTKKRL